MYYLFVYNNHIFESTTCLVKIKKLFSTLNTYLWKLKRRSSHSINISQRQINFYLLIDIFFLNNHKIPLNQNNISSAAFNTTVLLY